MKKVLGMLMCFALILTLGACSEKELEKLDTNKTYTVDDTIKVKLKSLSVANSFEPTNLNDEYTYWDYDDKSTTIVNAQFYVENLTDKTVKLKEYLNGKLIVNEDEDDEEEETAELDYCIETSNFTKIENTSKLGAKEKTIVHMMFYVDKTLLKEVLEKDAKKALTIEVSLKDDTYALALKEKKAKIKKLEKGKKLKLDKMNLEIYSASAASMIPPLNANDDSLFYIAEDNKLYAGMYAQIENTSDEELVLQDEICVSLDLDGTYVYLWTDTLNADQSNFDDQKTIAPKETKTVLFFNEVDAPVADAVFTMNIYVQGVPYSYTFTRPYIAE